MMKFKKFENQYKDLPEYLILKKGAVSEICEKHEKETEFPQFVGMALKSAIDCLVAWTFSSFSFFTKLIPDDTFRLVFVIALTIILGLLTKLVLRGMKKRIVPFEKLIVEASDEESETTGIFIVTHRDSLSKQEEVKILTEQYGNRVPFLLYLHKFNDFKVDASDDWDEEKIKGHLEGKLRIDANQIEIKHIDRCSSIKTILDEKNPKLRIFHFFNVTLNMPYSVFKKCDNSLEFKTLSELKKDIESQRSNADVIDYLSQHMSIINNESFVDTETEPQLKIIWNITNRCGYNCEICATHSSESKRKELSEADKNKVLMNILVYGFDKIQEIDFSGGDPLQQDDCIELIQKAVQMIGREKICVTTTGYGLENVCNSNKSEQILYKCEITIDGDTEDDHYRRKENDNDYIINNLNALGKYSTRINFLTINVPIINPQLSEESINKLVDSIAEIKALNISVNLIRYMPVGAAFSNTDLQKYNDGLERFISLFKNRINEKSKRIECKLQCALRATLEGDYCNMLQNKIGIDCAGNVFACAWGGYVHASNGEEYDEKNIENNPFYLGNLMKDNLRTILESKRAERIRRKIKAATHHCRVYNYVMSGKLDDNCDILCDKENRND